MTDVQQRAAAKHFADYWQRIKPIIVKKGLSVMKKRNILMITVGLLLLMLPIITDANTVIYGECGDGVIYMLDDTGELQISGSGYITSIPWADSKGAIKKITINDGVKSIPSGAFSNCPELSRVVLPEGLKSIDSQVFYRCEKLQSINIPNSVTCIDAFAFKGCSNLDNITIPNSVKQIGTYAFESSGLKKITIPDEVTIINEHTFEGCVELAEVNLPNSLLEIKSSAFENCEKLERIVIPDSVTNMQYRAFSGCINLSSVSLSDNLSQIPIDAFRNCTSLESITLPNYVGVINDNAFSNCIKLNEIELSNVTHIGRNAFYGCSNLQDIVLPKYVYRLMDGAFSGCIKLRSITIQGNLTEIGTDVFKYCNVLSSISIPSCNSEAIQLLIDNGYEDALILLNHALVKIDGIEPTCTESGISEYWICNGCCRKKFTDEKAENEIQTPIEVPALGHDWNTAQYKWLDYNTSIIATHICKRDVSHIETETVDVTAAITSPTEESEGIAVYTSEEFSKDGFEIQTKRIVIPALKNMSVMHLPTMLDTIQQEAFSNLACQAVIFPEGSTAIIGRRAFVGCSKLLYVKLPASISKYPFSAFEGCNENLVIDWDREFNN